MRVLIIGAGKSGRGYLARLLTESGNSVVFADNNSELVQSFPKQYEVSFFSEKKKVVIKPEYIGDMDDPVIQEYYRNAECVFVSVGIENLADVGEKIDRFLSDECNVILCENGNDACSRFREKTGGKGSYGIVQAAIFCTTIEDKRCDILSEDHSILFCQKKGIRGKLDFDFIEYVDDFAVLMKRKLYTYNTISAIISYAGAFYGYDEFTDAAKDEYILKMIKEYIGELQKPICLEYGFSQESQEVFCHNAMKKFRDEKIKDSIERNARDPKRKLMKNERIMGPLRLIEKYGGDTSVLEKVLVMGFYYSIDSEWTAFLNSHSAEEVLSGVCMIEPEEQLYKRILNRMAEMRKL